MEHLITIVKFSRLANPDIKNAVYQLTFTRLVGRWAEATVSVPLSLWTTVILFSWCLYPGILAVPPSMARLICLRYFLFHIL